MFGFDSLLVKLICPSIITTNDLNTRIYTFYLVENTFHDFPNVLLFITNFNLSSLLIASIQQMSASGPMIVTKTYTEKDAPPYFGTHLSQ
jgi:hypothetical protein